jgi:pimeloyl-ACP methyl ester carboxylesterase
MEDLNDVVLVGHSLGGMVISGAAERVSKKIRRLVYLDALVPKHGQSAFDLNSAEFRSKLERQANEKGDGYKIAPIVDMLGITNAEDLAWVRPRLRPQPIATFSQSVDAPSFASRIPSTFILCKQFGFGATAERCCQSGWPVQEIDCGHDAMMIKPAELSELLISASH